MVHHVAVLPLEVFDLRHVISGLEARGHVRASASHVPGPPHLTARRRVGCLQPLAGEPEAVVGLVVVAAEVFDVSHVEPGALPPSGVGQEAPEGLPGLAELACLRQAHALAERVERTAL